MDLFTQDWGSCIDTSVDPTGVAKLSCIWVVISNIVNAALVLSGVVAVFLIVYSGAQYVMSRGDKERIDSARKRLTWAIIGLVFIFLSFVIIRSISQFTGVGIDQLTNPPGTTPNPTVP